MGTSGFLCNNSKLQNVLQVFHVVNVMTPVPPVAEQAKLYILPHTSAIWLRKGKNAEE